MGLPETGHLLRLFIGESDRYKGEPLYGYLVREARRRGLAGATVLRGLEGYGGSSRIHTAKILRLSEDLPIIVEIVDTPEAIEEFLPVVDEAVDQGLATVETVRIRFYRTGDPDADVD